MFKESKICSPIRLISRDHVSKAVYGTITENTKIDQVGRTLLRLALEQLLRPISDRYRLYRFVINVIVGGSRSVSVT